MKQNYMLFKYLFVTAFFIFLGTSFINGQAVLKHSYTFEDGTANDGTGNADGVLKGDATISNGAVNLTGNGYVNLPAKVIDIPTYSSVSIEAVFKQGLGLESYFSVLYSFGQTTMAPGWPMGTDYFIYQPTRQDNANSRFSISCDDTGSPWATEDGVNGKEIVDTSMHYVVTILNATEMKLYLDGALLGTQALREKNRIANLSNDTAYIGASVYSNDKKWIGKFHEMNIFEGELDPTTIVNRAEALLGIPVANATLSSISFNKGELLPTFNPETDLYELYVDYGITSVKIEPVPTVKGATVEMFDGLGNKITDGIVNFSSDGIGVEIHVTALNGTTQKTYSLFILTNPAAQSPLLTGINLSAGALIKDFDTELTEYTAIVPYGSTSVNVTGVKAWSGATITGGGDVTLTDGVGSTTLIVTSQDGSKTRSYTVNLYASKVTTGQYYYIVNEASDNLVLSGSHKADYVPKLKVAFPKDSAQLFEFIPSGIDNEYFIRNKVPSYLSSSTTSSNHWDMEMVSTLPANLDSVRFTYKEFEPGRFSIYTKIRMISSNSPEKNMLSPNDANVGTTVYNDKWVGSSWDNDSLTVWNILPPDEVVDPYNTFLSSLSVAEIGINPAFDFGKLEYWITLPIGTNSITVAAVAFDTYATISGTGVIDVSNGAGVITITVTAPDPKYKKNYVIHYQEDTPLTLKHSYSFTDGTAQDQVGNADGIVHGGDITKGVYTTSVDGEDYITLPADSIALNTYPSITTEAYVLTGPNPGWSMLAYFGGLNGSNTLWMSIAGETNVSRVAIDQGAGASTAEGVEPGIGEYHHYVSILTNDTIKWYIDGTLSAKTAINPVYAIHYINTQNAWLCKSGYNDPTWIGSIYEFNIYSGQMADTTIANRALIFPADDTITDATLSNITVSGDTIDNFASYTLNYNVVLAKSVTEVPVVSATPRYSNASAQVTAATAIPGTTTIVVTAGDGVTTNNYSVNFSYIISTISSLSDLKVAGTTVDGFDPNVTSYTVLLDGSVTVVPTVTATATDSYATFEINNATSIPDTTTIVVTAEDGVTTTTYTVIFEYNLSTDATLSDLTVDGTTIADFAPGKVSYLVYLPQSVTVVPTVAVTTNSSAATAVVTPAASIPGTTTIVVTAEDNVTKKTYSVSFDYGSSVNQPEISKVQVFPTISNDNFIVKTNGKTSTITVYDVTGKIVINKLTFNTETTVNVSDEGMYIVKVECNGELHTFKVFKNK